MQIKTEPWNLYLLPICSGHIKYNFSIKNNLLLINNECLYHLFSSSALKLTTESPSCETKQRSLSPRISFYKQNIPWNCRKRKANLHTWRWPRNAFWKQYRKHEWDSRQSESQSIYPRKWNIYPWLVRWRI